MDLRYLAWKGLAFLTVPSNILVTGAALGLAYSTFAPWRGRLSRTFASFFVLALILVAFSPLPNSLIRVLEQRFAAFEPQSLDRTPTAIIVLGGAVSSRVVNGAVITDLNGAVDRLRKAAEMAALYPEAPVLASGGQAFPVPGAAPEADNMAALLVELGVTPARIRTERRSRTTAENARFAGAALGLPDPGTVQGPVLVVTSAFHMPRAMGAFRAAGVEAVAVPTDWRSNEHAPLLGWNAAESLTVLDIAVREYVGLLAYRLNGASDELFPGPNGQVRETKATQRKCQARCGGAQGSAPR